jgi:phosphoglucosamine mutase
MTANRLFGTDGIRGPFGSPPLDMATVHRLGSVLGKNLRERSEHPKVLLGGDTRESTPYICRWLAESLTASGTDILYAGVLPTPAISRLVVELECSTGVAISASHNPHPDNGIKLIEADGSKWRMEAERTLEEELLRSRQPLEVTPIELTPDESLGDIYLEALARITGNETPFDGVRVTLDCANGAASGLAARLFRDLGAEVESLGDSPDGRNINAGCGSTVPQQMAATTAASGSQVGFAFDGDADRVIVSDEKGTIRDGDAILFLLSTHMREAGSLAPARIVATSMSNLGLEVALSREGIELVRCDVGDRIVVRTLQQKQLTLGGEQSGHIVHLGLGATGDGLQTALLVTQAMLAGQQPLSELLSPFHTFPQILRNVRVVDKPDLLSLPSVSEAVARVEEILGSEGRLVLRYSGTEPLARIMIEGADQEEVEGLAEEIAAAIGAEIGEDE